MATVAALFVTGLVLVFTVALAAEAGPSALYVVS